MKDLSIADVVTLAGVLATCLVLVAGAVNRWAVANHRDRLASFTGACANAAGRVRDALAAVPPGADRETVKAALIAEATRQVTAEFERTGRKLGATPEKAAGIIAGQLGQLPSPVAAAPVVVEKVAAYAMQQAEAA